MFMFYLWVGSIIITVYIADQKKLGSVGYFFLSLITGPVAVFIVLMMPTRNTSGVGKPYEVNTLQEAKKQLQELQFSLYAQEEKIKNLEILINKLSGTASPVPFEKEIKQEDVFVKPLQVDPIVIQGSSMPLKKSDMELDFGRNWLNKIGIAVLALGVAFLISYTFKYFGPFLKIAFGYVVAGVLFFVGLKLEKTEKLMNYGRALLGGSWAIIYFTTYAMHHFEASRIINSQSADLFLLGFVTLGMMGYALKYKSEAMMAVVLSVAYLTSTIGHINEFTIISLLFLAVLILFLAHKFQWIRILSLGVFLTYGIHLIWVMPNVMSSPLNHSLFGKSGHSAYELMNFIFLTCYGLVFFLGIHLVRKDNDPIKEKTLAASNFGNIAAYSILSYCSILNLFYDQRFMVVLIQGIVYLVAALVMKTMNERKMFVSDIVAAIFALTFSITLKFLPTLTLLIWLVETPCLLFIGLNFKEKIYKYFSYALTFVVAFRVIFLCFDWMPDIHFLGLVWSWHGFICFWASISMAICFYLMRKIKEDTEVDNTDKNFDHIFSCAASIYLTSWVWSLARQPWISVFLSMEGLSLIATSIIINLTRFRMYAYVVLAISAMIFIVQPIAVSSEVLKWFIVGSNTLIFFGLYYAVKSIKQNKLSNVSEDEMRLAFIAGIIILVVGIHQYVSAHWISLSLGMTSVVVILIGFFNGNKTERMGGLALLALTLGRVVLIDLSGLDIIFKIITLIILGILFLGVSYVYNRFSIKKD